MAELTENQSKIAVEVSPRIGYLYNSKSGKNRRASSEANVAQLESNQALLYRRADSLQEIYAVIDEFIEQSLPLVVIHAGDGTVQAALTRIFEKAQKDQLPVLALLPGGTTNMTYGDVGWHGEVDDLLNRGLAWTNKKYFGLKTQRRSVMRMQLSDLAEPVCGMFFGAGIIHSGILYCRQNIHTKGVRGEWGPGIAAVKLVFDWIFRKDKVQSIPVKFMNGEAIEDSSYTLIAISTLDRLFLNLQPFWSKRNDETLRYTLIDSEAKSLWRVLPRILRGLAPKAGQLGYRSGSSEKLVMNFSGGFTLDGQLFGSQDSATEVELCSAGYIEFLTYD